MAFLLRMCDEDREKWGGPEWVRFDPAELDDIPWDKQHEWEWGDQGLDMALEFLLKVDWPAKTARGKAAAVWLARTIAGEPTPRLREFSIKTSHNKLTIRDEGVDADPPGEAPSSTEDQLPTG